MNWSSRRDLGDEIGMLSGSVAALTVLGAPDLVSIQGHLPIAAACARSTRR
jgi:hypothetical protein